MSVSKTRILILTSLMTAAIFCFFPLPSGSMAATANEAPAGQGGLPPGTVGGGTR